VVAPPVIGHARFVARWGLLGLLPSTFPSTPGADRRSRRQNAHPDLRTFAADGQVERTVIPHLTTIGGLRTHRPRHSGGSGTRALPPLDPHGHDIRKLTPTPPRFGCVRRTSVSEWPEHASHLVTRRKGEPSQLWCASFLEDDADHAQALFGRAVRERAARMVLDHRGEYPSIFAASR